MEEVCARPGCGHRPGYHHGDTGCEAWDDEPRPRCRCSSYRTQAQQEAWDQLRQWIGSWDGDTLSAVGERLLELYP
jgi:hypothetical protein